jgi:hypothetical protein
VSRRNGTWRCPRVPDDLGHWLAGFTDGEGCFQIRVQRRHRVFNTHFSIALRVDDRPILDELQRRLGVGVVRSYESVPPRAGRAIWEVGTQAGCCRLIEIFDHYPLRAKKRRDYAIWREAVREWCSDNRSQSRLEELREQLRSGRAFDADDDFSPPAPPPSLFNQEAA